MGVLGCEVSFMLFSQFFFMLWCTFEYFPVWTFYTKFVCWDGGWAITCNIVHILFPVTNISGAVFLEVASLDEHCLINWIIRLFPKFLSCSVEKVDEVG